jgi:hypothetical protein
MKVIPAEYHKFLELQARSAGTPYRDILNFAELLANELEDEFDFSIYNQSIAELEKKLEIRLSIGDIGEILILLSSYWAYGVRLLEQLSHIESKIVAENIEYRLSVLAQGSDVSQ